MSSKESDNPLSREELEERIIAMLMGELDANEVEIVETAIADDEVLRQFQERMQATLGMVQKAVETNEVSKAPTPLRLSDDRRDALFAKLRTVEIAKTEEFQRRWNRKWIAGLGIAAGLAVVGALIVGSAKRTGRVPAFELDGIYAMSTGEPKSAPARSMEIGRASCRERV